MAKSRFSIERASTATFLLQVDADGVPSIDRYLREDGEGVYQIVAVASGRVLATGSYIGCIRDLEETAERLDDAELA